MVRCYPLKVKGIDVEATLKKVERVLSEEKELSPAIRSMVELLIFLITLLANL
ncbi:phosphomannomutase [Candidatus Brocadia sinica JPN1]|uniref:Phosphomannomutase n=1 Tax=Candidatus Brocadia sinica JPN1 TaxID=1197129 RepID=A0ABQ0JU83_9BACT|nr:phosphomannomutase [Candidatus Brocadia sinica JPN1]